MMRYTLGKADRTSLGERQLRGRMGKALYWRYLTASCCWKSSLDTKVLQSCLKKRRLVSFGTGETVGELGAIIRLDAFYGVRKAFHAVLDELRRREGAVFLERFQIAETAVFVNEGILVKVTTTTPPTRRWDCGGAYRWWAWSRRACAGWGGCAGGESGPEAIRASRRSAFSSGRYTAGSSGNGWLLLWRHASVRSKLGIAYTGRFVLSCSCSEWDTTCLWFCRATQP